MGTKRAKKSGQVTLTALKLSAVKFSARNQYVFLTKINFKFLAARSVA